MKTRFHLKEERNESYVADPRSLVTREDEQPRFLRPLLLSPKTPQTKLTLQRVSLSLSLNQCEIRRSNSGGTRRLSWRRRRIQELDATTTSFFRSLCVP